MSRCPTCNKKISLADNPYRPFCSERCKLVDLGKWVSEEYRVPGKTATDDRLDKDDEQNDE